MSRAPRGTCRPGSSRVPSSSASRHCCGAWTQFPCPLSPDGGVVAGCLVFAGPLLGTRERPGSPGQREVDPLSPDGGVVSSCLVSAGPLRPGVQPAVPAASEWLRDALEAMAWVAEERGRGGARSLDGLAWDLSIDSVWEAWSCAAPSAWCGSTPSTSRTSSCSHTADGRACLMRSAMSIVRTCTRVAWSYESVPADDAGVARTCAPQVQGKTRRD